MNRNMIWLAGLTALALLGVVLLALNGSSQDGPASDALFLPATAKPINEVERVEIVTAGNNTVANMLKTADGWQLVEMGAYSADWPKLQDLLAALATARVLEPKTDKPEYYARMGVEDIESDDAKNVLVRLHLGDQVTGILVGRPAAGREGQYVRLQHVAGSVLIDRKLDVPIRALDWADRSIVDVTAAEVSEIEIIHPQEDRLLATKISVDQMDFDLVDLPQGREIKGSWAVNSLGSVLALLDFETVLPVDNVAWGDAVRMRVLLFSGVEIIADLVSDEDRYFVRLSATHPSASVVSVRVAETQDPETQAIEQKAFAQVAKSVDDINQRVGGWAYGIPKSKYDVMTRRLDDLLKPVGEP